MRSSGSAARWVSPPAAIGPGASETSRHAPRATRVFVRRSARFTRRAAARTVSRASTQSLLRRGRAVDVNVSLVSCGALGLQGCHRRRPFHTTQRDPVAEVAPDLVQRTFVASAPNRVWIADITYVPTRREGFLYLAVILDAFSRRVVGWTMAEHLRAELVVGALEMAVWNRRPSQGVIHHSDHGSQYTSLLFGERCQTAGHPLLDGLGGRLLR